MKFLTYTLLFLSVSFSFAQEESANPPQIAIRIPLGETVMIDSYRVEFVAVLEDSRCPEDVVCVWAGQAKVKVLISEAGGDFEEKEIVLGPKMKNILTETGSLRLKALNLSPPNYSFVGRTVSVSVDWRKRKHRVNSTNTDAKRNCIDI